jgi:hypothetical protein
VRTPAAALAAVAIVAAVSMADAREVRETPTQEAQVQEAPLLQDEYKAVWEWCGVRFPYREDLQEACKWGAYKLLPGQEVHVLEEGIRA